MHYRWSCQDSRRIWEFMVKVMEAASRIDSVSISFGSVHALLDAPLSRDVVPLDQVVTACSWYY